MRLLFRYDRSDRSVAALTALVTAAARASAEGMPVEIERELATEPSLEVPTVVVDGLPAEGTDETSIFNAIARAYRRLPRQVSSLPAARVR